MSYPPFTPDSEFAALETPRAAAAGTSGSLSISALARFEFEAGKANDGTKILMIEWDDDEDVARSFTPASLSPESITTTIAATATATATGAVNPSTTVTDTDTNTDPNPGSNPGTWHVSWEGKESAVLPATERTASHTHRIYFLLPPHVTIPPVVTLAYNPSTTTTTTTANTSTTTKTPPPQIHLNPLPAIFPPSLGADGRAAGKRGVLHTIWAKKRLQVLEKEIRAECQANGEGIALHMALQEREWIEGNFGVGGAEVVAVQPQLQQQAQLYPMGPTTPVSPGGAGGRLGEKLRGLRLRTGERELAEGEGLSTARRLLSPQSPDIAVSSFGSFHGVLREPSVSVPRSEPRPESEQEQPAAEIETKSVVAHYPPETLQAQQQSHDGAGGFASMGTTMARTSTDPGEELFAKALSPRTPDLPRSPFSFAPEGLHM